MNLDLINLTPRGDHLGWLIALENLRTVSFEIRRVYYIYGSQPGVRRGKHAHHKLRQMAVCLQGSCRFYMDDGRSKREISLDRCDIGLMIEPMIWHEMDNFSSDCILLVLASALYDESDYIRHYSEFARLAINTTNI
jgi:dTDP-4-dehydrorhamnose 3,5-epimerase-like enzyme